MTREKTPIDFLAYKKRKEDEKRREKERKARIQELAAPKNPSKEQFRLKKFFEWEIRDIEVKTGVNKYRQLEAFAKNLKVLRSYEDENDYRRAENLSYQELAKELRNSTIDDWKTRPRYYKIVFERIRKALNPKNEK
ncbi:MAG: hypothetical protein FJZ04_02635 [Candidatus Moranbacteria bacterium]|nr:hypothetical protein [Candidatus Moranbacteria bacterium]